MDSFTDVQTPVIYVNAKWNASGDFSLTASYETIGKVYLKKNLAL